MTKRRTTDYKTQHGLNPKSTPTQILLYWGIIILFSMDNLRCLPFSILSLLLLETDIIIPPEHLRKIGGHRRWSRRLTISCSQKNVFNETDVYIQLTMHFLWCTDAAISPFRVFEFFTFTFTRNREIGKLRNQEIVKSMIREIKKKKLFKNGNTCSYDVPCNRTLPFDLIWFLVF